MLGVRLILILAVMGGLIAFLGDKLGSKIGKKRIGEFDIENIYNFISVQTEILSFQIHHKAKPLLIVHMPEYGIVRIAPPEVFRIGFVFLLNKTEYLISDCHETLLENRLPR